MKLALLSDVHSNLHALHACLAHANAQGAQQLAFLGDLVGYGAQPADVVDCVMALAGQGAIVLRGNHEELAVSPPSTVKRMGDISADWTHRQLSVDQRDWLATLPLLQQQDSVLFVHASANAPERWRYVDSPMAATDSLDAACAWPGVRYVFGGHVHAQTLYGRGTVGKLLSFQPQSGEAISVPSDRRWVATLGSVGQPRDGNPRAMYALFDNTAQLVTFHRVDYNHAAAAQAIRGAGLPEYFARRLELGQ